MNERAAREQLEHIEQAGFEKLHFGWAGSLEPGRPHHYRAHGPTVLIEYDNTQNNANHIHSVWRDLERDFGGDLCVLITKRTSVRGSITSTSTPE